MSKQKKSYTCNECGATHAQWTGRCQQCGSWNNLVEQQPAMRPELSRLTSSSNFAFPAAMTTALSEVSLQQQPRIKSGFAELDRVLGGGIVPGSAILIGGDPGIGKSTLLTQAMGYLSQDRQVLYVSGEESLQQISLRAKRLQVKTQRLFLLAEIQVETIIATLAATKPQVVVIDSIQTLVSSLSSSSAGSVGQVRECASQLVNYAKRNETALFIIGHVTKDGSLAGPRVLEHMVDTVLYFEGQQDSRYRMVRAIKNRFGAVNELGVFVMSEQGLRQVSNPSAIFLSRYEQPVSGSVVLVTWEGTRPLLIELQSLVDTTHLNNPRRLTLGLEQNRLSMLLAVMHRHGLVVTYDKDIFINVVGGVRINETAADLAVVCAIFSSLSDYFLDPKLIIFGEVGLAGEIRPVPRGQERLREAAKHGFTQAIVPYANKLKADVAPQGMQIMAVKHLVEALNYLSAMNRRN